MATRVFVSFDYDNDSDLKTMLIGQSRNSDSPFEISDWSVKEASPTWRNEARSRIRASGVVVVICGTHTASAQGVATELKMARDEGIDYFLLHGRSNQLAEKPTSALVSDKVYSWTWENLKRLVGGAR